MKKTDIYILTDTRSERLDYVVDVIFKNHLGLCFSIVTNPSEVADGTPVINYSNFKLDYQHISIHVHPILKEDTIYAQRIHVDTAEDGLPFFFTSYNTSCDYGFDLFAMIFYQLSRYEEYLRFTSDKYGRFSAKQSLAYRSGFLERPLVDEWILDLSRKIETLWKVDIPLPRSFKVVPTIDIDTPYAFIEKPWFIHLGAIGRDIFLLRFKRFYDRLKSLYRLERDPFDTYDLLERELSEYQDYVIFFFLMNLKVPDDLNFSLKTKSFIRLVNRLCEKYNIGIHPSLQSTMDSIRVEKEKLHLEKLSRRAIVTSRQHFLSLRIPDTYQQLIELGISEDHSMAFHDLSGFRASTCVPYPAFNLKTNQVMDIIIYPVTTMDVTLRDRHTFAPKAAHAYVNKLKKSVKNVDGQFEFIWHNSSFSELYGWAEWDDVFRECLKQN